MKLAVLNGRCKLGSILHDSGGDLKKAQSELYVLESDTISSILDDYRPNVKRIVIETLVTNIPVPYANPVSIFCNMRDIKTEIEKCQKYNWFYLLRDIRNTAKDYS